MKVTSVEVKDASTYGGGSNRLLGYSVVMLENQLAIHDVKIIEGNKGKFVQMPSKRMQQPCPACRYKNFVLAKFCNECGGKLIPQVTTDKYGNPKLYVDIVHPTCYSFRKELSEAVLEAYELELNKPKEAGKLPSPPAPAEPAV